MSDDRLYLVHMSDCIRWIRAFTTGGRAEFLADKKTQDAVLRNLQTMAESSQRLSGEIKAMHPEIEWARIAAFRNVLVHDYLGVDLVQVWDILERDLAELDQVVAALLAGADTSE
ncbi:MAG: HepT-like ribonuclease domain-containing protein [Dehalococcoidia bacterium]